jgi:hypothetical protein
MKRKFFIAVVFGFLVLTWANRGHAEQWVKNKVDVPNKNVEANFYDADSIKVHGKTLSWTEKFVLTEFGVKSYTKHLSQYAECRKNIEKKGNVAYHKLDFEIKEGKYRLVAKRNYSKDGALLCTDKDMGTEFDKSWHDVEYGSPMYNRYYIFVTKYKVGNV